MTGKIIREVHKCAPPIVRRKYNKGTVWQCECGANYEIIDIFGEMKWRTEERCRELDSIRAKGDEGLDLETKFVFAAIALFIVAVSAYAFAIIFGGN